MLANYLGTDLGKTVKSLIHPSTRSELARHVVDKSQHLPAPAQVFTTAGKHAKMRCMDTSPHRPWQPNTTELAAARQLLGHLGTRFTLTTGDRLREIAATVAYARQVLLGHGPAVAAPGRVNLGSIVVAAIANGGLAELEVFNSLHPRASEADLLTARPSLIADLDRADQALRQLTQALETVSPPLATK